MTDAILALNAGSSSIKFALFAIGPRHELRCDLRGQVDGIGGAAELRAVRPDGEALAEERVAPAGATPVTHKHALEHLLDWLARETAGWNVVAAGHRMAHGGADFTAPVRIDEAVLTQLEELVPLVPLHQPHCIAGIRALSALRPGLPQVACFDTTFHCTQPDIERTYALPRRLSESGIRRYGFHGLAYEHVAQRLPLLVGDRAQGRVVAAHLGNGASMCAMRSGRSVASSMGFSALDGLVMGTRPGSIDPGVLLHLMQSHAMDAQALTRLLYRESGLLGVSGISHDMRALLASPARSAAEAVDLFCYRAARELGSLAVAAGGLDVLAFSGGIGENAPAVRERIGALVTWLGVEIDPAANAESRSVISTARSAVAVAVVHVEEERVIAGHTAGLIS